MLAQKFLVFEECSEQPVQIHLGHHCHERQSRTRFQGHPRFPVQDGQRPGEKHQQHPAVQASGSSQRELAHTELVLPLLEKRFLAPPRLPLGHDLIAFQ